MCSNTRSRSRLGRFVCRVIYHTHLGNPAMCLLWSLVMVLAVGWVHSNTVAESLSQSPGGWGTVTQDCLSPSILHSLKITPTPSPGRLEIEFSSLYFFAAGLGFQASSHSVNVSASCLLQQYGLTLIVRPVSCYPPTKWLQPRVPGVCWFPEEWILPSNRKVTSSYSLAHYQCIPCFSSYYAEIILLTT